MVLEDHRLPRVAFQIIIPGAGGYFDPPAMIGLSSYTAQMMREGTTTKTSQQISQELETMSASVNVGSSLSGPFATVSGNALTENLPRLFDLHGRRPAEPVVPGRRVGAAEDAHARRLDSAADAAGVPRGRAVRESDLRRSPGGPRLGDAGDARRDHPRCDGRVPQDAFRARPRAHRLRRRHQRSRTRARWPRRSWRRGRKPAPPKPATTEPPRARSGEGLSRRPPGLGADDAAGGHAVDGPHRSGLRAADRRQPRARRHDGPALLPLARREGLYLRDQQRFLSDELSAASGRRRPTCAPK